MFRIAVTVLLVFAVFTAQAAQITVPSVSAQPGRTVTANVQFGAQGALVTAIQLDLEYDPALTVSVTIGSPASAAGKSLTTSDLSAGKKRILIAGLNQNTLPDGVVLSLSISVPSSAGNTAQYPLHISNAGGTDKDGKSISLATVDGAVTVGADTCVPQPVGSMPQIASGGSWKTTVTVMNLATTPSSVHINFWGDDGRELTLPLTSPQSGAFTSTISPSLDRTIEPRGLFVLDSEASTSSPTMVGWAEVLACGNVAAFAVFRQRVAQGKDAEAVVPLETRSQSSFLLPFDNTAGFVTGMAVVNPSAIMPANLSLTFTDETGNQISSDSIALSARGHVAFAMTDRYPNLIGRRGVIELRNSGAGQLSLLGLRFNQFGSFTSIPAIAR